MGCGWGWTEEIVPPRYLVHARSAFFYKWGGVHFLSLGTKIVLDHFSVSARNIGSHMKEKVK